MKAVKKANHETGKKCFYAPCCNTRTQKNIEHACYAKKCGAGAIMLLQDISGMFHYSAHLPAIFSLTISIFFLTLVLSISFNRMARRSLF
jgi:hypothetical protein